jgi:hypothetical protein
MLAMVEGGNKVMIDHMRKHDKSLRALQATESKRRMSLGLVVGLASGGNYDEDEAFSKIYLNKERKYPKESQMPSSENKVQARVNIEIITRSNVIYVFIQIASTLHKG